MKKITSKDNQLYKLCVRLASRKYRDSYGQFLVEGEKVIRDAVQAGQKIVTVLAEDGYPLDESKFPCPCVLVEKKLFDQLAQTTTTQGILAIVEKEKMSREAFGKELARNPETLSCWTDFRIRGISVRSSERRMQQVIAEL